MFKRNYFILLILFLGGSLFPSTILFAQSKAAEVADLSVRNLKLSKFQLSIDGGLGYLVGSTKTAKAEMKTYRIYNRDANRYYDEIKWGEQAGVSIHYRVNTTTIVGLDYNIFTTRSSVMGYFDIHDLLTLYYGPLSEKIYTSFAGISLLQEKQFDEKWNFYGKLSAGMAFYRNEARVIMSPMLITGNAPALRGESGISYFLTLRISVKVGVSYLYSTLHKIEVSDGTHTNEIKLEGDTKENLSRLSVITGLQIHF